jgi:formamidopyrimidine-DNA glycosylase
LDNLGVEPLSELFDNEHLYTRSRKKQQNIKSFIMDSKIVGISPSHFHFDKGAK